MAEVLAEPVPPVTTAAENPFVLSPDDYPNIDHIVTEDDTPVDSIRSEKQQRLLTEPLYGGWTPPEGITQFIALANVGLFFAVHSPPLVPDMMLSLNVKAPDNLFEKRNRSYFMWEYGKPPEVVVEIVSNTKGGEDTEKLAGYARVPIQFYVIYDPDQHLSDQVLRVFRLDVMSYRPLDEPYWFQGVGLGLRLWEGEYEGTRATWLRWYDARGQLILTGAERAALAEKQAALAVERAALAEEQAARAVQQAERERGRAELLAEQLRQLGVEPQS
jgi:Uma2 family endonuclease